jgi:hypothetical protein
MRGLNALILLVLTSMPAGAAAGRRAPLVRVADEEDAAAVRRAVDGAGIRLASPRCQEVLTVFRDPSGRTLRENLDASGLDAPDHLLRLFFYSGDGTDACDRPGTRVFAATAPGSRVVFVCLSAFRSRQRRAPVHAEVIIIHEALHSLGLGEDPPSSEEITYRVRVSCG